MLLYPCTVLECKPSPAAAAVVVTPSLLLPREDGMSERSSPKSEIETNSEPPEEKVTARAGASCPSGGHVADIYLANINK